MKIRYRKIKNVNNIPFTVYQYFHRILNNFSSLLRFTLLLVVSHVNSTTILLALPWCKLNAHLSKLVLIITTLQTMTLILSSIVRTVNTRIEQFLFLFFFFAFWLSLSYVAVVVIYANKKRDFICRRCGRFRFAVYFLYILNARSPLMAYRHVCCMYVCIHEQ